MTNSSQKVTELATRLARTCMGAELVGVVRIRGRGEVNRVYRITTTKKTLVLRMNDAAEYDRFMKEEWCAVQADAAGASTPRFIEVGTYAGHAYTLTEYIEGLNGDDIVSSPAVWKELGLNLAKIHQVNAPSFGDDLRAMQKTEDGNWAKYLRDNIRALVGKNPLVETGVAAAEQAAALVGLFEALQTKSYRFGLCHGDYSLANTIVDDNRIWTIDWGSANSNVVPHHDFNIVLEESLISESAEFEAFLQGYGMPRAQFESMNHDMTILQLLEAVDKTRWAFDRAPGRIDYHTARLRKLLEQGLNDL